MSDTLPEYLKYFGEIKFAEEKSMSVNDYERSLNKHFNGKVAKIPRGRYKFAEINNPSTDDFEESFNNYFE
jgi:hypothetical protein